MRGTGQRARTLRNRTLLIEVEHVSKFFGDFIAIEDVSFVAERGEILGFLGPNGAGKTTTMRIITGFTPPSEGTVRVAGHDVLQDSLEARRNIGYLPETVPLYTDNDGAGLPRLHG